MQTVIIIVMFILNECFVFLFAYRMTINTGFTNNRLDVSTRVEDKHNHHHHQQQNQQQRNQKTLEHRHQVRQQQSSSHHRHHPNKPCDKKCPGVDSNNNVQKGRIQLAKVKLLAKVPVQRHRSCPVKTVMMAPSRPSASGLPPVENCETHPTLDRKVSVKQAKGDIDVSNWKAKLNQEMNVYHNLLHTPNSPSHVIKSDQSSHVPNVARRTKKSPTVVNNGDLKLSISVFNDRVGHGNGIDRKRCQSAKTRRPNTFSTPESNGSTDVTVDSWPASDNVTPNGTPNKPHTKQRSSSLKRDVKVVTPYERVMQTLDTDKTWQKEVAFGRRIGLYRFRGDIGNGNFSQVKVAVHTLTKGTSLKGGH